YQHHQTALIQLQSYLELFKVANNAKPHCHASANQLQGSPWMVELAAINSKLSLSFDSNVTYLATRNIRITTLIRRHR
ncbi:hypothetical protein TSAR_015266, partial [Trichomalopsis sarcophagae]